MKAIPPAIAVKQIVRNIIIVLLLYILHRLALLEKNRLWNWSSRHRDWIY